MRPSPRVTPTTDAARVTHCLRGRHGRPRLRTFPPMSVRVLLFARYAELLGRSSVELPLPAGARVRDVVAALRALPGGDALPAEPLVALGRRQASATDVVAAGDEVALLPPLAGG